MEMNGSKRLDSSREVVWQALNDPEVLKRCIPGCESLEKTADTGFTAQVTIKVGPVKAKFNGKVTLSDIVAPQSYTLTGEGQGGVAGFAKAVIHVRLEAEGERATNLQYDVKASVGGKLAQVGARLIDATARKLADQFFERFAGDLAPGGESPA